MKKNNFIETNMLWPGQIEEVIDKKTLLVKFADGFAYDLDTHEDSDKSLVIDIKHYGVEVITKKQYDTRVRLGKKSLHKIWRSVKGNKEEYLKIVDNDSERIP